MDIARPFEAFLQEILLENSLRFFVLFFGFGVDSIWNILSHLDAVFEQKFSRVERIKMKERSSKIIFTNSKPSNNNGIFYWRSTG